MSDAQGIRKRTLFKPSQNMEMKIEGSSEKQVDSDQNVCVFTVIFMSVNVALPW